MKIIDYDSFHSQDLEGLRRYVNAKLKENWQPFGHIVEQKNGDYYQCMVKYEAQPLVIGEANLNLTNAFKDHKECNCANLVIEDKEYLATIEKLLLENKNLKDKLEDKSEVYVTFENVRLTNEIEKLKKSLDAEEKENAHMHGIILKNKETISNMEKKISELMKNYTKDCKPPGWTVEDYDNHLNENEILKETMIDFIEEYCRYHHGDGYFVSTDYGEIYSKDHNNFAQEILNSILAHRRM